MSKKLYLLYGDYFHFDYEFYIIPRKVLKTNVSNNAKILFTALHKFRSESINVSNSGLAKSSGINVSSISSVLKELDKIGLIRKSGRGNNRIISPYKSFDKIQRDGNYIQVPAFIIENKDMNCSHKVMYITLLNAYITYLKKVVKKVKLEKDLYTNPITRSTLSKKLYCDEDTVSQLIKCLVEKYSYKDYPLVDFYSDGYYSKYITFKCNLLTPSSKEGFDKLKEDLGIVDDKVSKDDLLPDDLDGKPITIKK